MFSEGQRLVKLFHCTPTNQGERYTTAVKVRIAVCVGEFASAGAAVRPPGEISNAAYQWGCCCPHPLQRTYIGSYLVRARLAGERHCWAFGQTNEKQMNNRAPVQLMFVFIPRLL